jgi:hypothetical protein
MNFRDPRDAGKRKSTVDIGALNRDESLVAALGRGDRPHGVNGDPVVDLLFRWRADLEIASNTIEISAPVDGGPVPDTSRDTVKPYRIFGKAGRIAIAAAAVVIAVGSLGGVAVTRGAQPGSIVWPIAQALNTDRARSVQSAAQVTTLLNSADQAIQAGKFSQAGGLLAKAQTTLVGVQEADGAAALKKRLDASWAKLAEARGTQPNGKPAAPGAAGGNSRTTPSNPGSRPRVTPSQSTKPPAGGSTPGSGTPSASGSPSPSGSVSHTLGH